MHLKHLYQSKKIRGIFVGLLAAFILLVTFQFGVMVGFRKAQFAGHFGDAYMRNFEGRDRMTRGNVFFKNIDAGRDMSSGHGAIGQIVSVTPTTLVINGPDGVEKIIVLNASTTIKKFKTDATVADLQVDARVAVLGMPDEQGQIVAKLIRIIPNNQ